MLNYTIICVSKFVELFEYAFVSQDPHADEFEDKEWTFFIENVSYFLNER